MDYQKVFDTVSHFLEEQGIECYLSAGKPPKEKAIARVEDQIELRLPSELREFYLTMGDGVSFVWESPGPDERAFGIIVPKLKDLANMYTGWRGLALYTPEKAEKYGFPYTSNPGLAKRTAAQMWHWLPIIDEDNGDLLCIDMSDASCSVIFHKHDWMDGGTGADGHLLADNFGDFIADWSRVCFQSPRDLHWPTCFQARAGIDWKSEQFDVRYRIPEGYGCL